MVDMSRRMFLKRCAGVGLGLASASYLGGCLGLDVPLPPVTPTAKSAKVAAILGTNLAQMVREALNIFGGAEAIISPGQTVFLKPNFSSAGLVQHDIVQSGDSTKPEIVIAVAEECLKAGASRVIIGDAAQVPRYSWKEIKTLDQSSNMFDEARRLNDIYSGKVILACLNSDSPNWIAVPSPWTSLGKIYISSYVAQADKIISLPVIKTHRWTQITGALKNFVGVTPLAKYGSAECRYVLHNAVGGIEQSFLDIVSAIKPHFSLMDISVCCEGNGPHVMPGYWGTTIDVKQRLGQWVILAGPDPVAVDATAARVIGIEPAGVKHLLGAYNMGLGQMNENAIELVGASLNDIQVEFHLADPTNGFLDILWPGIMLKFS